MSLKIHFIGIGGIGISALAKFMAGDGHTISGSDIRQSEITDELALKFGANDLGSTMMEENVVASAGVTNQMNQEEMIKLIRDIGEFPAKRDTAYNILEKF